MEGSLIRLETLGWTAAKREMCLEKVVCEAGCGGAGVRAGTRQRRRAVGTSMDRG